MDRIKAIIISAAVMLMLGCISWMTAGNDIHAFRVIEGFFACYGFLRFGTDLFHWMQMPPAVRQRFTTRKGSRHAAD